MMIALAYLVYMLLWARFGIFEPRDLWIGVYWKKTEHPEYEILMDRLFIYVCLVPTLPIMFYVDIGWRPKG